MKHAVIGRFELVVGQLLITPLILLYCAGDENTENRHFRDIVLMGLQKGLGTSIQRNV